MTKTKIKAPIPIPFKSNGNLLGYSELKYPNVLPPPLLRPDGSLEYQSWDSPNYWKDNYTFSDILVYKGISCGRSAVNPYFISELTGANYHTFASEFDAMMPYIIKGRLSADFTFSKRGSNYGLVMISGSAKC